MGLTVSPELDIDRCVFEIKMLPTIAADYLRLCQAKAIPILSGMAFLFCVDNSRLLVIFCHGVYAKPG
jgi:hypothetical protein